MPLWRKAARCHCRCQTERLFALLPEVGWPWELAAAGWRATRRSSPALLLLSATQRSGLTSLLLLHGGRRRRRLHTARCRHRWLLLPPRLAVALQLPPAAWGATLLLLSGGVGAGAAAACSLAMLQSAGKISFSPCLLDFPIPRRRSLSSFIPPVSDSATAAVYV